MYQAIFKTRVNRAVLTPSIDKLDSYLALMEETRVYWEATLLLPTYGVEVVTKPSEPERSVQVTDEAKEYTNEVERLGCSRNGASGDENGPQPLASVSSAISGT